MSAKSQQPKRSGMGSDPLSQGLFTRTDTVSAASPVTETVAEKPKQEGKELTKIKKIDSRIKKQENRFLKDIETAPKEPLGLQVSVEVNDWLDDVVKVGRRKHGKKIPKQMWVQAGIELLRAMPVEWSEVSDLAELRSKLNDLSEAMGQKS